MAKLDEVQVRVVAPVPYFPLRSGHFGRYAELARVPSIEVRRGLQVTHPRYPSIPKFGMTIAPWLMAAALFKHLRGIQRSGFEFDIIDAYYLYPDGVAAVALGLLLKKPVILTAFGSDVSLIPAYLVPRRSILWATQLSRQITAVCQALKDGLIQLGIGSEKVHVIRHGVDLELFRPPGDRARLRKRLGLDRPTLVSVGHLIDRKGHDIAVRAMSLLRDHELLIIGEGPEEGRLRRFIRELGLENRVKLTGRLNQSELASFLGAADVLVNCSDREGIANVLLESMACGTPVAATCVWGSPEVVTVAEAGVLLRERSAPAVAEGVLQLLASPPDRALTRRYAECFSWDDAAREHVLAIRRTVGSACSPVGEIGSLPQREALNTVR
jgi:glycosyltransferase involved in cell wall biosynthesis